MGKGWDMSSRGGLFCGGILWGITVGVTKGDTRSLDYRSYVK